MPALYAMLIPMTSALTVPWLKIPNMGGLITVHKKRWETPPCGGQFGKNVYFHARIPSDTAEIGGCGLEVVKVGADGLENSDNDLRKRAVLSGTLFVSERFRRQGVAQRLLLEAEGTARWWGMDEMILIVAKGNAKAQSLYQKVGYKMMPQLKEHGSQVCMRKHLYLNPHNLGSFVPSLNFVENR